MTDQYTRTMSDDEIAAIEDRLALYDAGDRAALATVLRLDDGARPVWYVDLVDLLNDARASREQIKHLTAELRIARGLAS